MESNEISYYKNGYNGRVQISKNQKVIQIHRIQNGINFEANYKALATLTEHGYILYMYLIMHSDNRVWALSNKDVIAKTPLTKSQYHKAVHDLIENGYLIKGEINMNGMCFSENAYHFVEDNGMEYGSSEGV